MAGNGGWNIPTRYLRRQGSFRLFHRYHSLVSGFMALEDMLAGQLSRLAYTRKNVYA